MHASITQRIEIIGAAPTEGKKEDMATTLLGLSAAQAADTAVVWSTQRNFTAGVVRARLTDVYIDRSDMVGGRWELPWKYVDYSIGVVARSGPKTGQIVASKAITRYWGQSLGYISLGSVPAGTYSLRTMLIRARTQDDSAFYQWNQWPNPWVRGTFDLQYGA